VTSKLDFNNCLLYGLPDCLILKLQRIQNAAARMVLRLPKHCHITPVLIQLHWLPITYRIDYKVLLMVYKALNNLAPEYIRDMLKYKPVTAHSLRSNDQKLLMVPRSHTVTYGDRNFRTYAPKLWNVLPFDIRNCDNVDKFKQLLKTVLFNRAFN